MAEESKDDNYVTVKGMGTMTTEEAATVLMNYANRENLEFEFELVDVKKYVLAFRRNQYRLPLIRVTNTVNNETYHLKPEKIIGGGTYGIIVKYNCPTKDLVWTIKIEQLDNASETGIITNLNDKKIHCGQITAYHLGNTEILIISKTKEITTVRADFNRLETMQGDLSQDG